MSLMSLKVRLNTLPIVCWFLPVIIILAFAIGFRPLFVGADTLGYSTYYDRLYFDSVPRGFEYFFDLFSAFFTLFTPTVGYFFTFLCLINFILIGFLASKISDYLAMESSGKIIFLLLICCFSLSPFFYSIEVNVIRHGTAILCLFLFYLLLLCRANPLALLLTAIFALGFHKTTILYLFLTVLVFLSYTVISNAVFILAFFYVSGLSTKAILLFSKVSSINVYEKINQYGLNTGYSSGNRFDFAFFTIFSGLMFFIIAKYLLNGLSQKKFLQLLKIYWILTIPFFLLGFGSFSDRYLLPAWLYLSVLMAVFFIFSIHKSGAVIRSIYFLFLTASIIIFTVAQGLLTFYF